MKGTHVRRTNLVSLYVLSLLLCSCVLVPAAFATNGMNLEGYGPIATGMGGASMAYDNGSAAVMNNPATLTLMKPGNRIDAALGFLGPDITSSYAGMPDAKSSADAFYMPAFGWMQKSNRYTYGIGVFAQGGMGTEYDANPFMSAGSPGKTRSEVGVGRALLPLAYEVNENLGVAATLDFVWASMDLKMALSGQQFGDMVAGLGGTQTYGTADGSMVNILTGAFTGGQLTSMDWARFDFSDDSPYSGKAKGTGFAGKLGVVYKINQKLTLGATYHSKTALDDLEAKGATLSMQVNGPGVGGGPAVIPVTGTIKVRNFEWPATLGVGAAYQVTSRWLIAADYKRIEWADVMKNFKMTFTADANQANPLASGFGLAGQEVNAVMYQNWENQNVVMLGTAYKFTDQFTGRLGLNLANNPVSDNYMNPLFPATIRNHATIGAGYDFTPASSVNASVSYAPEVKVANGQNVVVAHSQTNWQLMYSHLF